jgi:hypothetical protein
MIKNIFFAFYWIFQLYKDGFSTMSKQSKTLWIIGAEIDDYVRNSEDVLF